MIPFRAANVLPVSPLRLHSFAKLAICVRIAACFAVLILTSLGTAKMSLDVKSFLERSSSDAYETLTLHRLRVCGVLGRSLKTTNCLESVNALVEERCAKIDHRKNSSQRQRWLASALVDIEMRLRKLTGYLFVLAPFGNKPLELGVTQIGNLRAPRRRSPSWKDAL